LAQLFGLILVRESGITLSIARKALPNLKATAMRDFFNILKEWGVYRVENHNKSDHIYNYRNNQIEFFGLDDPMKVRSRRRNYLWLNEANEFSLEAYRQLSMRTDKQIFLDYNPSHFEHWIYDELQPRDDAVIIRSTYKDNPFLPEEVIKEIEHYKKKDKNYWRIYGLGLRGVTEALIYTHWNYCDKLPDSGERIFGLDFGYNSPTALAEIVINDDRIFAKERIYRKFLKTPELVELMKDYCDEDSLIYADAEDPQAIDDLIEAGFLNTIPADKEKGSVRAGIREIQKREFYITKDSQNGLKEVKSYCWKEKDGKLMDEPVKINDHFMDAVRYSVYTYFNNYTEPSFSWL